MNLFPFRFYREAKRKKMKTLSICILTLFVAVASFAQSGKGSFKGKVTDKANNQAISQAQVHFKNEKTKKITSVKTDKAGLYEIQALEAGTYQLTVEALVFQKYVRSGIVLKSDEEKLVNVQLQAMVIRVEKDIAKELDYKRKAEVSHVPVASKRVMMYDMTTISNGIVQDQTYHNTESYNAINENRFKDVNMSPLSTFSVDVDAASYSNVRRFLTAGQKPDKGAVRLEEMINYFSYDYPNPTGNVPFSITTEIGDCPWSKNKLVHIGLQGSRIDKTDLPNSNLVFLLDVSGSMSSPNKLPLLKRSFKMLVNELGENDRIAIVVYAGAAGVVLPSTSADNKEAILAALDKLQAGGSTAGGQGIELAYKVAQENFIRGGNNRVILATDGDFNIGMSSDASMQSLIEKKRETGVFLTCLGFGTGNLKDSKMETLADKGNGNYAYIDNVFEAKKVLVTEMGATLLTLAKDVKLQVEFNPSIVKSYRLIGYENRLLNDEDFDDDTKDAGEIGAGHSVTALYEVVLNTEGSSATEHPLRYQSVETVANKGLNNEILTVKFRYKEPDGTESKLLERNLLNYSTDANELSNNFKFSAAVAGFGMLLRESEFAKDLSFDQVRELAMSGLGKDEQGYRDEFLKLIDAAKLTY
jgi:Ca-activated chloride channel family protein